MYYTYTESGVTKRTDADVSHNKSLTSLPNLKNKIIGTYLFVTYPHHQCITCLFCDFKYRLEAQHKAAGSGPFGTLCDALSTSRIKPAVCRHFATISSRSRIGSAR